MTDKEKIRAEIVRHLKEDACGNEIAVYNELLSFIDCMQENPINDAFAKVVGYLVQDVVANEKDAANYANYKRKPTSYFVEKYQSVIGNLIKKAWHRGSEEPKDNSKVIVCQVDDKTQTVLTMEYHSSDKYFHLLSPLGNDYTVSLNYPKVRWAYPENLLPIK